MNDGGKNKDEKGRLVRETIYRAKARLTAPYTTNPLGLFKREYQIYSLRKPEMDSLVRPYMKEGREAS